MVSTIVVLSAATVALAQAPKPADKPAAPAAAPTGAAKPAAAAAAAPAATPTPPPAPPKPAGELDALKYFEGNWRCEGKAPAGPMGPEHGYKSTFKVKKEMDGFWYQADYEQKKSKDNPAPMHARGSVGFDSVARKLVFLGIDNFGGMVTELSPGWEGDKLVAAGEGSAMGQKIGFRETFTKKGDKEMTWMGEVRMGKDWTVVGNDTCKK
jgi:hypothetical protein